MRSILFKSTNILFKLKTYMFFEWWSYFFPFWIFILLFFCLSICFTWDSLELSKFELVTLATASAMTRCILLNTTIRHEIPCWNLREDSPYYPLCSSMYLQKQHTKEAVKCNKEHMSTLGKKKFTQQTNKLAVTVFHLLTR